MMDDIFTDGRANFLFSTDGKTPSPPSYLCGKSVSWCPRWLLDSEFQQRN